MEDLTHKLVPVNPPKEVSGVLRTYSCHDQKDSSRLEDVFLITFGQVVRVLRGLTSTPEKGEDERHRDLKDWHGLVETQQDPIILLP